MDSSQVQLYEGRVGAAELRANLREQLADFHFTASPEPKSGTNDPGTQLQHRVEQELVAMKGRMDAMDEKLDRVVSLLLGQQDK